MKVLKTLTIKNLKLNKKRTIVTIIGVILSVALICAVGGMFTCFRETLLQSTIQDTGYYHIKLDTTIQNKNELTKNRDIKNIMNVYEMGYSFLENSQNKYKPYIKLFSLENPSDFLNLGFNLIEGRYPANQNEVIISKSILTNGKVNYKIGDILELNLGKRYACGSLVEMDDYLNPIYKYNDLEEVICESENIQVENTLQVKVVGIIERPNYIFESYSEAGYSVITTGIKANELTSYITLKKPSDYQNTFNELKTSKKYQNISLNDELLRWEVFKFSDSTLNMLLTIISVVIAIIMITSIFCIRNSFAISVLEKTKMFGMLASIGATKKQIKKCVLQEGFIIGIIGIPIGILSGLLADFILIIVINKVIGSYLLGNSFVFKVSLFAIFISIILGIITIYLSAIQSARRASRTSPIDAIRNANDIKIKENKLKTPKLISKIFKVGGVIAYKNLKRSKKKYRTTVVSIVVSILAFITMNSFINYGFSLTEVYYTDYGYNLSIYLENVKESDLNMILSLPGIENYSLIQEVNSDLILKDLSHITDYGYEYAIKDNDCNQIKCVDRKDISLGIIVLDNNSFKNYVESNNLNYDKVKNLAILNDNYLSFSNDGKMIKKRIYDYKDNMTITGYYQNQMKEFTIKVLDNNPMGMENYYTLGGYLFLNQDYYQDIETNTVKYLYIQANDAYKLEDELEKLNLDMDIHNIEEAVQEEKATITLFSIFLYGFITVITLIGVTNIFNTITANMSLRQKEFMVLKSIGMTKQEFNRMINLETIFYSFKALFYGIILGIFGSFLMYKAFATSYDTGFSLPYKAILISIISVILLVFVIMHYSIKKINKQNIIETIRKENV